MLREILRVRQNPGEPPRRWFTDDEMDLFVWGETGEFSGFQLSYDKHRQEKALTWHGARGYTHDRIDDGANPGRHPASPILLAGDPPDFQRILANFQSRSGRIDPQVAAFVEGVLGRNEPGEVADLDRPSGGPYGKIPSASTTLVVVFWLAVGAWLLFR